MQSKELKHQDLVTFYTEGESVDSYIYSEQRSNLQLVAGNHYARKGSRFWGRIRDDKNLTSEQKIRITKNHIQRVCKIYENNIISFAPTVAILPKNESELQDQKQAELNNSVWADIKYRHKFKDKTREQAQDFIRIGEVACEVFWDETKGKFLGYEQSLHEESGQPEFDEMGRPVADKGKPRFTGDFVFNRVYGFNLWRSKEAKSMDESWFIGTRTMVSVDELKAKVGDDEEKLKFVEASRDETYVVFDGTSNQYPDSKDECLLLKMYIRPSAVYPNGYFYIYTKKGILWQGELPFGIFPIAYAGFDEIPTQPRCHSIIKQIRPNQAEINRASSKVAEHQITLADDKVLYQAGTKLANGGSFPGVRGLQYAGAPPTILPGRTGDQYFAYIDREIAEMYKIANLEEEMQEKPGGDVDPYTMLFKSMSQKKKYSAYSSKFERFQAEVCEITLSLAKEYYTPEMLVPVIGRAEFVNVAEFKNSNPLCYSIKLDPATEDLESRMGKQLSFNQIMQYVGANLSPDQLGRMIRTAPYLNDEQAFDDLTLEYDNSTNMILALDRGELMPPSPYDDPKYMAKRLVNRKRRADFKFLPPQVQQNYDMAISQYEQIEADQALKMKQAQAEFIPNAGMGVPCDLYVPDPNNSSKTMRARVPSDALTWLLKRLEEQGMSQEAMMNQQQGVIADVAQKFLSGQLALPDAGNGQGPAMQPQVNPQ